MTEDYSSSSSAFIEPGIVTIDSIVRTLPSIPAEKYIELFQEWAANK